MLGIRQKSRKRRQRDEKQRGQNPRQCRQGTLPIRGARHLGYKLLGRTLACAKSAKRFRLHAYGFDVVRANVGHAVSALAGPTFKGNGVYVFRAKEAPSSPPRRPCCTRKENTTHAPQSAFAPRRCLRETPRVRCLHPRDCKRHTSRFRASCTPYLQRRALAHRRTPWRRIRTGGRARKQLRRAATRRRLCHALGGLSRKGEFCAWRVGSEGETSPPKSASPCARPFIGHG